MNHVFKIIIIIIIIKIKIKKSRKKKEIKWRRVGGGGGGGASQRECVELEGEKIFFIFLSSLLYQIYGNRTIDFCRG